ncbi:hypothetical protein PR048_011360 [Dryococelus australis]|uniref:XPG-I domain-containing protein n=1 Tax=Dryococelus australis TaxID=614101 RepID=A0ABQ9HLD1_9NEOP|nr:hypothetical protein PR048_011360 [Dryococelus australis]
MCGKWHLGQNIPEMPELPEWKGFMHLLCEMINSEKSEVIPLPFINSPPTNDDTLYTALRYAAEDASHHGLMTWVWSDMAIEQTLMCDMKSEVGLTRGRGLSDSVLAKWVGGACTATTICSSLKVFVGDRGKLAQWLADHPPFAVRDSIMSLSTGVIGNSNIIYHKAVEIDCRTMETFVGMNFTDMKPSKKNAKRNEVVVDLLKYELSPYPVTCMQKTKKSSLYNAFPLCSGLVDLKMSYTVVDGGFLPHRVKWNVDVKSSSFCEQYISYLINHSGANSAVVFDGYEDQEKFLANEKNKTKLIELLVEMLTAKGIEASTAIGDADGSIIRCSLNKVTFYSSLVVIGEDVDLLVLLTALTLPDRNVYFMKLGRGNIEDKCFLKMPNETKTIADILCNPTSTPDTVAQAGEEMFLTMYQAPPNEDDLNNH